MPGAGIDPGVTPAYPAHHAGLPRAPRRAGWPAMPPTSRDDTVHSEAFLRSLMRRQLRLSIGCALAFLVALLGLPLANYYAPGLMAVRVGGFTLTWLILGVLFFPYVWLISGYFIKRSLKLEADEAREVLSK